LIFEKVLDQFYACRALKPTFTDFYDPAKWTAFSNELAHIRRNKNKNEIVKFVTFGGAEGCERRMFGFFAGSNESKEDQFSAIFPIKCLRICHNSKFNKMPRHQDYLGSILGLGLDRGRIGDIIIGNEYSVIFVYKDIADYICENLNLVGRVPVAVTQEMATTEDLSILQKSAHERQVNVASMRLDAIVAAIFRISRSKSVALIRSEKVFVNWSPIIDPSKQIKPSDMVTLRGHGRAKIGEILGETKKERLRISVLQSD